MSYHLLGASIVQAFRYEHFMVHEKNCLDRTIEKSDFKTMI